MSQQRTLPHAALSLQNSTNQQHTADTSASFEHGSGSGCFAAVTATDLGDGLG
jgi:hypothetical protein